MKSLVKLLLIALPILSLGGCAAVIFPQQDRLAMSGNYSEIAGDPEVGSKSAPEATGADLVAKCIAYSRLKSYAKLFSCVQQIEGNIARGDKLIEHHGFFSWNYPENIEAIPGLLRTEAYIDFGDYEKAISSAKASYDLLPAVEWTSKDLRNAWGRRCRIRALGMLALANALKGERKSANQAVAELEGVEASSYEFWMTPGGVSTAIAKEKRFYLARANMALGNYDKVLDDGADFWEVFGSLSEGLMAYSMFAFVDLPKEFMKSKALYETGRIKEAKSRYDSLLSRSETKSNGEIYWPILFDRGRIAQAEALPTEAIAFYQRAVEVIESQRSTINTEASKIGFVGDKQAVYGKLVALLVEQERTAEAFDYVERSKSRSLVDVLAAKKEFAPQGGDAETVRQSLQNLSAAELASHAQDVAVSADGRSGVRSLRVAQQQIAQLAPELSTLVSVSSIPLAELSSLIGADETLVEYYYQGPDAFAFVLTQGRLLAVRLQGEGLLDEIQAFRSALEKRSANAWQTPALALYRRIWLPLEGLVNTDKVVIVAHGALHYLPFAALRRPDGGFLLDRTSLRLLPSASVLKFLKPWSEKGQPQLLVLGNPDLGDARFDLEFAADEAKLIAKSSANSRLLLRKDASETNFKNSGKYFSRVHFASHGKFNADSPLDSGLYLAKDAANDGVLTVGELYSTTLNADLVTLSACETGLGRVASGDDVVGLARGFLYAGSRSIVASLWSVDDQATGLLMKTFYENLKSMRKDEALRQAQIRTRRSFAHPYYWAAFQLTGRAD